MGRSGSARNRRRKVEEDDDWVECLDSGPEVRAGRILGPEEPSSEDDSEDEGTGNEFKAFSYKDPKKKAGHRITSTNGRASATKMSSNSNPPRIPSEASFDGSQDWLNHVAQATSERSRASGETRKPPFTKPIAASGGTSETSSVTDATPAVLEQITPVAVGEPKTVSAVSSVDLEDQLPSANPAGNGKRVERKKRKYVCSSDSSDEDENDPKPGLPLQEPTPPPFESHENGCITPSHSGEDCQMQEHRGGDFATTDDEAFAADLQAEEYGAAGVEGEQNGGDGEQEGNSELELISSTLQKCERIATTLRQDLHSGSILQDRYAEVDPSTAKIVTQADISAACGTSPSDTSRLLKPYQLVGVNFMMLLVRKNVGGAILADEMGLGKTVQAVTFLALLRYLDNDPGPHLIVCPASVLENWKRELQTWCPSFKVVLFHGNERASLTREYEDQRKAGMKNPFNVLLTCYTMFERRSAQQKDDRRFLSRWKWSCVLMDEAHFLKDRDSLRSRRLRDIAQNAKNRIMLTGTPLQNDLKELWSLLEFLMPEIFEAKKVDLGKLLGTRNSATTILEGDGEVINHMKAILTPFVLRRVKADVMQQLVPKKHKVEVISMTGDQSTAYQEAVQEYRELTAAARTGVVNKTNRESDALAVPRKQIQNIFTQLRKVANHPLLIRRLYSVQDVEILASKLHAREVFGNQCTEDRVREELMNYNDHALYLLCAQHQFLGSRFTSKLNSSHPRASAKCQLLAKLLPKLKKGGHRSLVFSQWTQMLDILEWLCEVLELKYLRLDGSTQVRDRQLLVDKFNGDSSITLFLLSTRAGGQGLNLTGADTVIIHDVDFNPQMDKQAEDRCHRIGQRKPVTVYRLVTKDTVDEGIYNIAKRKLVLDAAVLESGGAASKDKGDNVDGDVKSMGEILSAILTAAPS